MDQATLVSLDLQAGEKILAVLEESDINVTVAALALFPEYGDWRLVLSSPSLDQTHLLRAHDKVAETLHGHVDYPLPIMMIFPVKAPFIRELRRLFGKAKNVTGVRLGGQSIGDRFVLEAYVYKIVQGKKRTTAVQMPAHIGTAGRSQPPIGFVYRVSIGSRRLRFLVA